MLSLRYRPDGSVNSSRLVKSADWTVTFGLSFSIGWLPELLEGDWSDLLSVPNVVYWLFDPG